jgi:hypothetical protein
MYRWVLLAARMRFDLPFPYVLFWNRIARGGGVTRTTFVWPLMIKGCLIIDARFSRNSASGTCPSSCTPPGSSLSEARESLDPSHNIYTVGTMPGIMGVAYHDPHFCSQSAEYMRNVLEKLRRRDPSADFRDKQDGWGYSLEAAIQDFVFLPERCRCQLSIRSTKAITVSKIRPNPLRIPLRILHQGVSCKQNNWSPRPSNLFRANQRRDRVGAAQHKPQCFSARY